MGFRSFLCCRADSDRSEKGKKNSTGWRIFSLKELHSATNKFNYDNKLGEGGFGSVYWGQLWDGSQGSCRFDSNRITRIIHILSVQDEATNHIFTRHVITHYIAPSVYSSWTSQWNHSLLRVKGLFTDQIAVKRLKAWSNKAEMEFAVEVEILGRVRHKNLLSLRGYCAEGQERLIVYDYMPNLSLLSHLQGQHSAECLLDWGRRMNIAIGSAEGIAYLHHHATPHIIHRDVKASNVLLDSEFQARVADFGFAKLIPDGATHVTTRVKGTLGYLAPEYAMLGKASESCDVYSFGILLLELASGKKPIEKLSQTVKRTITDWALPLAQERKFEEMADPRLNGDFVNEELKRMVIVALVCSQNDPDRRPTMLEVVELLKGESMEKLVSLENSGMFNAEKTENYIGLSNSEDGKDAIREAAPVTEIVASDQ